ncbi:hypothetical protein LINPERHAP2_LOCUS26106 [Linum perenne]
MSQQSQCTLNLPPLHLVSLMMFHCGFSSVLSASLRILWHHQPPMLQTCEYMFTYMIYPFLPPNNP